MPTITSLEPQKKHPHRFNVFINGQFAFGADEDLVVNEHLTVGKIIELRELDRLLFETEVGKLMERMYRLLSVRQRSEKEIRNYLRNLSFKRQTKDQEEISEAAIELLVERLKQKGLINDLEFAKAWVEARRKSKQKGSRALKAELFQKGINKEVVEEAVSLKSLALSEEELAKQALEKKTGPWKNLELEHSKKKAIEFLMRRGFEYEVARDVVENLVKKG